MPSNVERLQNNNEQNFWESFSDTTTSMFRAENMSQRLDIAKDKPLETAAMVGVGATALYGTYKLASWWLNSKRETNESSESSSPWWANMTNLLGLGAGLMLLPKLGRMAGLGLDLNEQLSNLASGALGIGGSAADLARGGTHGALDSLESAIRGDQNIPERDPEASISERAGDILNDARERLYEEFKNSNTGLFILKIKDTLNTPEYPRLQKFFNKLDRKDHFESVSDMGVEFLLAASNDGIDFVSSHLSLGLLVKGRFYYMSFEAAKSMIGQYHALANRFLRDGDYVQGVGEFMIASTPFIISGGIYGALTTPGSRVGGAVRKAIKTGLLGPISIWNQNLKLISGGGRYAYEGVRYLNRVTSSNRIAFDLQSYTHLRNKVTAREGLHGMVRKRVRNLTIGSSEERILRHYEKNIKSWIERVAKTEGLNIGSKDDFFKVFTQGLSGSSPEQQVFAELRKIIDAPASSSLTFDPTQPVYRAINSLDSSIDDPVLLAYKYMQANPGATNIGEIKFYAENVASKRIKRFSIRRLRFGGLQRSPIDRLTRSGQLNNLRARSEILDAIKNAELDEITLKNLNKLPSDVLDQINDSSVMSRLMANNGEYIALIGRDAEARRILSINGIDELVKYGDKISDLRTQLSSVSALPNAVIGDSDFLKYGNLMDGADSVDTLAARIAYSNGGRLDEAMLVATKVFDKIPNASHRRIFSLNPKLFDTYLHSPTVFSETFLGRLGVMNDDFLKALQLDSASDISRIKKAMDLRKIRNYASIIPEEIAEVLNNGGREADIFNVIRNAERISSVTSHGSLLTNLDNLTDLVNPGQSVDDLTREIMKRRNIPLSSTDNVVAGVKKTAEVLIADSKLGNVLGNADLLAKLTEDGASGLRHWLIQPQILELLENSDDFSQTIGNLIKSGNTGWAKARTFLKYACTHKIKAIVDGAFIGLDVYTFIVSAMELGYSIKDLYNFDNQEMMKLLETNPAEYDDRLMHARGEVAVYATQVLGSGAALYGGVMTTLSAYGAIAPLSTTVAGYSLGTGLAASVPLMAASLPYAFIGLMYSSANESMTKWDKDIKDWMKLPEHELYSTIEETVTKNRTWGEWWLTWSVNFDNVDVENSEAQMITLMVKTLIMKDEMTRGGDKQLENIITSPILNPRQKTEELDKYFKSNPGFKKKLLRRYNYVFNKMRLDSYKLVNAGDDLSDKERFYSDTSGLSEAIKVSRNIPDEISDRDLLLTENINSYETATQNIEASTFAELSAMNDFGSISRLVLDSQYLNSLAGKLTQGMDQDKAEALSYGFITKARAFAINQLQDDPTTLEHAKNFYFEETGNIVGQYNLYKQRVMNGVNSIYRKTESLVNDYNSAWFSSDEWNKISVNLRSISKVHYSMETDHFMHVMTEYKLGYDIGGNGFELDNHIAPPHEILSSFIPQIRIDDYQNKLSFFIELYGLENMRPILLGGAKNLLDRKIIDRFNEFADKIDTVNGDFDRYKIELGNIIDNEIRTTASDVQSKLKKVKESSDKETAIANLLSYFQTGEYVETEEESVDRTSNHLVGQTYVDSSGRTLAI